MTSTLTK